MIWAFLPIASLANPKLAIFFVALFPQFVGDRASGAGWSAPRAPS